MATQTRVRSKDAAAFETGTLSVYGGVVSGFVSEYADALGCSPEDVLEAVEAEQINLYFDTAEQKNGRKRRDRPTCPDKRCLAMREQELALLRKALENDSPEPDPEAAFTGSENVKAWTTPDPKKADVCSSTTKQLTLF